MSVRGFLRDAKKRKCEYMPMGAEITGKRDHVADRRWRLPDADDVALDPGKTAEPTTGGAADSKAGTSGGVSDTAWELSLGGSLRLSHVERANPAFSADGDHAASGAYGGRGPRVDSALAGEEHASTGVVSTGRWVRTGGCSVRWLDETAQGQLELDDERYWRWVTTSLEQMADKDGSADVDFPEPVACGAFRYLENGDGTATLVAYEGTDAQVEVPRDVDGIPVAVLGASLFASHTELEEVALPDTLRAIDDHAFDGCTALTHIELPESVTYIGMLAFAKSGLVSVRVPASVRIIGEKAFFHCKRLTTADLVPGLRCIGEMAFAYSGVTRAYVPASVVDLGFNAFDLTPAQKHAAEGTLTIDSQNRFYRFDGAGLYRLDALVELIGYVSEYEVAAGTRRIANGACKRHPSLAHVVLPEGLVEIGDDAFCSNRKLVQIDMPESLERIGARAFVDTSLFSVRISANVREIGENALLVQGESQMKRHPCLSKVDLDDSNERFYLENGLLCERGASPDGGDACLLYVGPDNVVRIPNSVTMICAMAFGSTDGVDELYVHDHVRSFCYGWLSTARTVPLIHVDFGYEVDGYVHGDFRLPSLSSRFRYPTSLFGSRDGGTVFDFEFYDSWVTCTTAIDEFAPAAYGRLRAPMGMSEHARGLYEGIFARKSARICRYFAERGDIEALEFLMEQELIGMPDIEAELEVAMRDGRGQATACLLEIRHRNEAPNAGGIDFSL